jgi:hypothetical protein
MDYQNIALSATNRSNQFNIVGDGIWYVDATPAVADDTRIKVTPAGGSTIVLKAGQSFRTENKISTWTITSMTGAEVFTGNIIIGNGDFEDNNATINGTVSTSIANQPTVNLAAGSKVQEEILEYSAVWSVKGLATAGTAEQIVTAAANVSGIMVYSAVLQNSGSGVNTAFIAKAGAAPAAITEGDLLAVNDSTTPGTLTKNEKTIRIPAGKGLYFYSDLGSNPYFRSIRYRLL